MGISVFNFYKSYVRSNSETSLKLFVFSMFGPLEAIMTPYLIVKLSNAVNEMNRKRVIHYITSLVIFHAIVMAVYDYEMHIFQTMTCEMTSYVQRYLMDYLFINYNEGIENIPSDKIIIAIRDYAGASVGLITMIVGQMIPDFLSIFFQVIYLAFGVGLVESALLFVMFSMALYVIVKSVLCNSEIGEVAYKADNAVYTFIGDILDNFKEIIENSTIYQELESLSELGEDSKNKRLAEVREVIIRCIIAGAVIVMAITAYLFTVYKRILKTDTKTKNPFSKPLLAVTILFSALSLIRSILYNSFIVQDYSCRMKTSSKVLDLYEKGIEFLQFQQTGSEQEGEDMMMSMNFVPDNDENEEAVPVLEFKNINFSYNGGGNNLYNKSLYFKIYKGDKVLITGPNGCGKTTLLRLIMKHARLNNGEIFLNGTEYRKIDANVVRSVISYANQNSSVFNRSVYENIVYGLKTKISKNEVIEFIKTLGLEKFLNSLPNGIETVAGIEGKNLSGGQRQIISVIKILLKGSDVILLDEITSAMDVSNKHILFDLLKCDQLKDKTIIYVSHDDEIINVVNKIIDFKLL